MISITTEQSQRGPLCRGKRQEKRGAGEMLGLNLGAERGGGRFAGFRMKHSSRHWCHRWSL